MTVLNTRFDNNSVRKAKSLESALPWLYLKGISTGEMAAALEVLVGSEARGLSASTVARLKQRWGKEYKDWCKRSLGNDQWVYLWVDGVYSGLRAADAKLCALVIIGVNERGDKHLLAIEDGIRESTQSWREVLLDLKARGMNNPGLAVGDGAKAVQYPLSALSPSNDRRRAVRRAPGLRTPTV